MNTLIDCWIAVMVVIGVLILLSLFFFISSPRPRLHTLGCTFASRPVLWGYIAPVIGLVFIILRKKEVYFLSDRAYLIWQFTLVTAALLYAIVILWNYRKAKMRDIRSRDQYNFWIQTTILFLIGTWIVSFIVIFGITEKTFLPFSLCAALLGWIFQDTIKCTVAYYHLYLNDLVHVGDWIEIENKGLDGEVIDISLASVVVKNWDNTISAISTSTVLNEQMKNWQSVVGGKTTGRRMIKTFTIDHTSIRVLQPAEIETLRQFYQTQGDAIVFSNIAEPILNLTLFRLYLLHWLKTNNKVATEPRLLVRLQDPTTDGMPLQVYAFLLETSLQPYELVQSEIIEHVLLSLEQFDLHLSQSGTVTVKNPEL